MITKMIKGLIIFEGAGEVVNCSCHGEVVLAALDDIALPFGERGV